MVDTIPSRRPEAHWLERPALQQPEYPDADALERVLHHLATLPPLVTSWEVRRLKTQLAEAAHGRRFLLQGGDCAESFSECTADVIASRLKVLMQMSLVLVYGLRTRVIRAGRFAGQYAKPRSSDYEERDGVTLPAYRGDVVNGAAFNAEERTPDPRRMVQAYSASALTLNFVRALSQGGFADLHHPEYWDLDFVQNSPYADAYHRIVEAIRESISFVSTMSNAPLSDLERAEFFTCHEALHLHYEQALTRFVPRLPDPYNLSTHFPWIGLRTAQPDGAHVEYARRIANPVAVKVGAEMTAEWLRDLLRRLDPHEEPGRLTLIARMGADKVADHLPRLIDLVRAEGRTVLWVCDPMHGNTEATPSGRKTRRFENIQAEVDQSLEIHARMGSRLGGVHLELTGEDVTECTGGARGLANADLERAYRSQVDPRLNAEQALELVLHIVRRHHLLHG